MDKDLYWRKLAEDIIYELNNNENLIKLNLKQKEFENYFVKKYKVKKLSYFSIKITQWTTKGITMILCKRNNDYFIYLSKYSSTGYNTKHLWRVKPKANNFIIKSILGLDIQYKRKNTDPIKVIENEQMMFKLKIS